MNRRGWLLLLLLLLPMQVKAAGVGSIRLRLKDDSLPVPGGTITLYEITQWGCGGDWSGSELAAYAAEYQIPGISREVDPMGEVLFEDLEAGTYLLVQTVPPEGYYPMEPFTVGLPLTIHGETTADIIAEPKMKRRPPNQQLPQTGQLYWPVWLTGGIGIVLMTVGIGLRRKE